MYMYMVGEHIYSIIISNNIMEYCHAERYFVGLLLNEFLNMYITKTLKLIYDHYNTIYNSFLVALTNVFTQTFRQKKRIFINTTW